MRLGVMATICVDDFGLAKRSAAYTAKWRDRVDERQQLGNVVAIRANQDGTDGDAIGVDEDVTLRTWSRAIGGVRASFSPAPTARTEDESTAACEKSSSPTSRNFASSSSCNALHTPALCQSRKRFQQVGPEPNPRLVQRSHQRIPVLNTFRMPFSAARLETGSRPGCFLRRGFGGGSTLRSGHFPMPATRARASMHMHNSDRYTVGRWSASRPHGRRRDADETERRQRCGFWW